jgi:malate dehydrogenase (oxaloacetate-decarboxylating)(NADP+)
MTYLRSIPRDIDKYVAMRNLQDDNEDLFYYVALHHTQEIFPIIYTPTVGEGCTKFSLLWHRPRGAFLSITDRGSVREILETLNYSDIRVIVITDGERILGLGDLGVNGMGIPIGKLALYTACAGVHPEHCLPITIDVGTNKQEFLDNEYYLGLKHQRIQGKEYDEFVEEVMFTLRDIYDYPLIQFEDFGNNNAFRLLEHYKDKLCTFNDDIQGTASVILAGLFSAIRVTGKPLNENRFLFLGSGEAGLGTGELIVNALLKAGIDSETAHSTCWFFDSQGLVVKSRWEKLTEPKRPFAHEHPEIKSFLEAVQTLKPTAIIGVSGVPQSFTEEVIREMAAINERPIIFSLSNPTSKSECTAEQAYMWSDARALFASGSPFPTYIHTDGKLYIPQQGNNSYIFPGVGLGVVVSRSRHVTNDMFYIAAARLAEQLYPDELESGSLYPVLERVRDVSVEIGIAVAKNAIETGLSDEDINTIEEKIRAYVYNPTEGKMKLPKMPKIAKQQLKSYWLADYSLWPLLVCVAGGIGIAAYQGGRLVAVNPDTKVSLSNRGSAVRGNEEEGRAFYNHPVRRAALEYNRKANPQNYDQPDTEPQAKAQPPKKH